MSFPSGLLALYLKYTPGVCFLQDCVDPALMQREPFYFIQRSCTVDASSLAGLSSQTYFFHNADYFRFCNLHWVPEYNCFQCAEQKRCAWFPSLNSQHLISHSKISTTHTLVHVDRRKMLHHQLVSVIYLRPETWQLLTKLHLAYKQSRSLLKVGFYSMKYSSCCSASFIRLKNVFWCSQFLK